MSSWFLKLANFNMVNPKIWLKISNSYSKFFTKGRFPTTSWNVYNRVLAKRPKTNNNVESWHGKLNSKATYKFNY